MNELVSMSDLFCGPTVKFVVHHSPTTADIHHKDGSLEKVIWDKKRAKWCNVFELLTIEKKVCSLN